MLQALPIEVVLVAANGRVLAGNEAWLRFAGLHAGGARAAIDYRHVWASAGLVSTEDSARIAEGLDRVLSGAASGFDVEVVLRGADDRGGRLRLVGTPLDAQVPSEGVVVMHLLAADATSRRFQNKFTAIFDASPVAIVMSEAGSNRIVHANPAMLQLLDVARVEDLDPDASRLGLWETPDQMRELAARVLEGRPVANVEVTRLAPHPARTLLLSIVRVSPTVADETPILVTMAVDVTERRLLEEQFRQAQKIEAVGRLAGGVAHDFNNLLTVIIGYNESLDLDEALGEGAREAVQQIRFATDRATMLTRQLLAFSRRQVLQPQTLDLRQVTSQLVPMLQRLMGEDVELVTSWGEEAAVVRADPGQLEQVLMNLAVNARDAMPRGGRLSIDIGTVTLDAAFVAAHPYVVPGRYVELTVIDTGSGMTTETKARVFEPFFTTKPAGQGTGLGLAMVYGIVKQSQGYIWVESDPGHGATFRIVLPLSTRTPPPERTPADAQGTPRGTETVLLVEDEEALRELDRQILMRFGYRVLHARTGPEAIEVAQAHPGVIHLLLTDVVMPSMSGRELADALRKTRPEMKVLYMSGYTADAVGRHGISEATAAFIQKPMSPPELGRKVRQVLDG